MSLLGGILALGLHAGEFVEIAPVEEASAVESNSGDWCDWLTSKPGTLYKGDNPYIQEVGVFGRFQWQAAYIDGEDVNGDDFDETFDEVRRFRLGGVVKFLNYFTAKANVNMAGDARPSGGDLDWNYQDFDTALLTFNAAKAFGLDLDALDISYGRHKFVLGYESIASSKKIMTPERSAISNKVYGSYRPTGFVVEGEKGDFNFLGGIFSTDEANSGFIGGWGDGLAYTVGLGYQVTDEFSVYWDYVFNGADENAGEESLWAYSWASSVSTHYDAGKWGVHADFYLGDNGDEENGATNPDRQGSFWGAVVMPYYWLVDKKLQAVARYAYASAEEAEGIRTNSRYFRRDNGGDVNSGRGDSHHSIYAGLNWLLCKHNLKIQTGVEYETLDTPDGDANATTLWLTFRTYF